MYRYSNGAFYPYSGMSEYIAAGVWPSGGVDVDDVVFAQFSGPAPSMMELGSDVDGMPAWVAKPVYAKPGDSAQQFGGTCPYGWVEMQSERPEGDYVASETGEWVIHELTYAEARKALNEQFYSDRDSLGAALANVQLLDGAEQETRTQDLRLDYSDLIAQYSADVEALKSQYGV